ncbi:MAG: hypothetical protein LBS21_04490 [Clostridiales bacterium]|jgi:hypothetical protein|nr:hypothetical protein [Clostridiales bacterium]
MKNALKIINNERGDIGVKQIALAVAAVVVIAFLVSFLTGGWLEERIGEVWTALWDYLQGLFA